MWEDSTRAMTNIRQNFALPVSGLNQQWTLADRPVGREVRLSDFELVTRPLPPLRDGEVLVRTLYLSVAPVMRQYMLQGGARHWSDPWHWAQTAIVAACRTHGILPVDGPFGDFSDDEGFRAQARRSATLGMVGKWAIHPKQVALANEVFTPSAEAVAEAREILAAMQAAKERGEGAAVYKGRLVDIASIRQAEVIVAQSDLVGAA